MVAVAGSGIDKAGPHSVTLQPDTVAEGLFRSFHRKRPSKHIQMGEPMSYWLAVEKTEFATCTPSIGDDVGFCVPSVARALRIRTRRMVCAENR